ncbi:DUF3108 domain-containing protein [Bacteroides sp. 224]|uniref:DUF3108 domain-containing protein n=1 Tax=Bacteroides sp. 224 TaxID=2302936 RepID=UPI0013D8345E|nr:DUF3108 domain-containing protein [Bacteroides sp. 224]
MNQLCKILNLTCLFILPFIGLHAQREVSFNSFQAGEVLNYDMYFKYGLLYTKVGSSSISMANTTYKGEGAYKATLIANSSGLAQKVMSVSDTIHAYTTKALVPLAYTKDAHEGKDHTIERATYTYSLNEAKVRNINRRNGKLRYDTTYVAKDCMYDVLSIIYYVRTLNYNNLKKGDKVSIPFFAGSKKGSLDIEHHGMEKITANNNKEYNCIKLVMMLNDPTFQNKNEAMKIFITNDSNRIPIRIDSKLKLGSTRVILKSYSGLRN